MTSGSHLHARAKEECFVYNTQTIAKQIFFHDIFDYPFKEQINQISGVGGEVQPLSAFTNPGTPQSPLVCLIPCSGHLGINPALLCPALPTPQTSLGEIMILKSFCKQQKPV